MEYVWKMYGMYMELAYPVLFFTCLGPTLMPTVCRLCVVSLPKKSVSFVCRLCTDRQCPKMLWIMYAICMEYVWNMYGICMEYACNMDGMSMEYAWNMYGIWIEYVWNMCGICM